MVRLDRLALLASALLLGAAAPSEQGQGPPRQAKHAPHHPSRHARQPVANRATRSEPPRVATTPGFTAAPVPDFGKTAPVSPVESRTHAEPTLFDLGNKYQGDGYVYPVVAARNGRPPGGEGAGRRGQDPAEIGAPHGASGPLARADLRVTTSWITLSRSVPTKGFGKKRSKE